jgi:uncharacterized repeat protein (TIGR02543 family)
MKPKNHRWATIAAILLASTSVACAIDSDGDGLDNSVETNTGIYVSATNTGTNPQNPDTDGDGVPDGVEVKEHTSPVDATKFNSFSKGMVAYYPFDGNASDTTGKGNTGIETNVTYTSGRFANPGSAVKFSTTSSVEIPSLLGLSFRPVTYSMWIKFDQLPLSGDATTLIGRMRTFDQEDGALVLMNTLGYNNELCYYTGGAIIGSGFQLRSGEWYNIAFSYTTDGMASFSINGKLSAPIAYTAPQSIGLPFRIGASSILNGVDGNNTHSVQGSIDDVRIYNRALDSGEVKALYSSERPHFQIIQGSYNWQQAKADAEAQGGRLAVLNTPGKIDEVNTLLQSLGSWPNLWLGAEKAAGSPNWFWIDGSSMVDNNWGVGEPNGSISLALNPHLWSTADAQPLKWSDDRGSVLTLSYLLENPYVIFTLPTTNGTVTGAGEYKPGATATLTAVPNPGYKFTGWTGDASGTTNPLSIAMDADKSMAATFAPDMSDSDDDGLNNYEEVTTYGTDPTKDDTDGDGLKDGWEVGVGRFSIIAGTRTWPQARADAHARGGELACFPTEDRWTRGMASLGAAATDDYTGLWIGATDATVEGTWTWVNGEAFSYSRWASSRPSVTVGNTLDYAEVAGGNGAEVGMWYDRSSSTTRDGYILEAGHATDPKTADVDGDGLNDGAEQTAGTNPFLADTDSDGYLDGAEVEFGGNPLAAASVPGFKARTAMIPDAGSIQFSFPAQQGISYTVLDSTNLMDWKITESNVIGQGAVITRSYSTANQPKRYFRARRN